MPHHCEYLPSGIIGFLLHCPQAGWYPIVTGPVDAYLPGPNQGLLSWDRDRREMPLGPAVL